MNNPQLIDKDMREEVENAILRDKANGVPDVILGQKYGITFRYLEKLITKKQGINVSSFETPKKIKTLHPKDFKEEATTVWSFKSRGNWATHSGEYRGNWSPYIPRNVILKYSKPGELVLDYFCGAGTTAVESKLLGRRCIALDINDKAIELAKKNINFEIKPKESVLNKDKIYSHLYEPELLVGDARSLSFLQDDSVDLICAHPPYTNIIHYTNSKEGDLSFLDIDEFLEEINKIANESYRVLKPGRQCAILIGDMRKQKHVIPLGFKLIEVYLNAGFKLRELVIKRQHNCKSTGFWYTNSIKYNFLLLAHEYLPIFEKPKFIEPPMVKEKISEYGDILPGLKRPSVKRRLSELESTTVWVFPHKDFEKQLNKNVIDRYSDGKAHKVINLVSRSVEGIPSQGQKYKKLLFIKSPCLESSNFGHEKVNLYLQKIKDIVTNQMSTLPEDGFCVIQTKDIRVNGYIEPLAKCIVNEMKFDKLLLKEIIVITNEKNNKNEIQQKNNNLMITHQYLLVFRKTS